MLETTQTLQGQAATLCGRRPGVRPAARPSRRRSAKFKQNIDVMRSLHNAFGYAAYKTDAPFYY